MDRPRWSGPGPRRRPEASVRRVPVAGWGQGLLRADRPDPAREATDRDGGVGDRTLSSIGRAEPSGACQLHDSIETSTDNLTFYRGHRDVDQRGSVRCHDRLGPGPPRRRRGVGAVPEQVPAGGAGPLEVHAGPLEVHAGAAVPDQVRPAPAKCLPTAQAPAKACPQGPRMPRPRARRSTRARPRGAGRRASAARSPVVTTTPSACRGRRRCHFERRGPGPPPRDQPSYSAFSSAADCPIGPGSGIRPCRRARP